MKAGAYTHDAVTISADEVCVTCTRATCTLRTAVQRLRCGAEIAVRHCPEHEAPRRHPDFAEVCDCGHDGLQHQGWHGCYVVGCSCHRFRPAGGVQVRVAATDPVKRELARDALYRLMSELSEECWFAGWLLGTEHALSRLAHAGGGAWGMSEVTAEDAADLLRLAELAGGWWIWPDDEDGDRHDNPIFVEGWQPAEEQGQPA